MSTLRRVQTVISGSLVNGGGISTHYFDTSVGAAQDAATAVLGFWATCVANLNNGVTFTVQPFVTERTAETGATTGVVAVTGGSVTGSTSFEALPAANQALLRLRTGVFSDGREIRGRLFIPGITEADHNVSGLLAALKTQLEGAAVALRDSTTANWVVWRRPRLADPLHVPPISARAGDKATVVSIEMWNKPAVLRSRRD